jgi:purine-binding chemotaxis protein CheW
MAVKEKIKERDFEDEHFIDDDEDDLSKENKYLTFRISDEVYGIDISDITEIIEMQKITDVPDMPNFVKGVINLRGKVIPIMDLRLRFNMEEREYDDRTCVIIVNISESTIGFIVDTVLEVVDISEENIDPPPQFKTASGYERYVSGIGKIGNDVKIILDADKIVHREELDKIKQKVQE